MEKNKKKKIVILGAGLAGLRLGARLSEKGFQVELHEKESFVGGLLQTIERNGFIFDLGPHIFFDEYLDYYQRLLGDDLLRLHALYGIGFDRKQIQSPINPINLIKKVSPLRSIPLVGGLASRALFGSDVSRAQSADEWVTAKFGDRANEYFFRYYIEKSTGLTSTNVSAHWCTERHRFYKEHNLWGRALKVLSRLLKRSTGAPLTLYYTKKGAQIIAEKMADGIKTGGGSIVLNSKIVEIGVDNHRVRDIQVESRDGGKRRVDADLFANTLPITTLWNLLLQNESVANTESPLNLKFRNLWLFYFFIKRPRLSDKVQIYFPEKKYVFKRIYEPKNLNPAMGAPETTGVCVEVGYTDGDAISTITEDELAARVKNEMADFYSLKPDEFLEYFSLKVPYSYPIYELGYEHELMRAATWLFNTDNIFSLGRQGLFRYDFMTNRVMESADALAEFILSGKTKMEFFKTPNAKAPFF
ncbi:FAD-dependent oxidoreductase [Candidatus Poribacteria bacterium]|nr:FAD-dependent oxidoreductase [Candidatus Poribacteria bacterium]